MDEMKAITDAVLVAINPALGAIHEKINAVAKSVSTIEERTQHMPTREQVSVAIESHATSCRSSRRWMWGIILGLPAVVAGVAAIVEAFR
jgi:hypothetical protein